MKLSENLFLILCISLALQVHLMFSSGIQGDEAIWDARGLAFAASIIGEKPIVATKALAPINDINYVDFTDPQKYPEEINIFGWTHHFNPDQYKNLEYPFTIRNPAYHPGMVSSLLIGLSHVFLSVDGGNLSLELLPVWISNRIPGILFSLLSLICIFAIGRKLFNEKVGLIAAAFFALEPAVVGIGPLARIDMSAIFFATLSVLAYIKHQEFKLSALHKKACLWSAITAFSIAACLLTNPYAATLLPVLFAIKATHTEPNKFWSTLFDRYDVLLIVSFAVFFLLLYPNIWPDPLTGLLWHISNVVNAPHAKAETAAVGFFHLTVSPTAITLWTWAAVICSFLFFKNKRESTSLQKGLIIATVWFIGGLTILSLVPGKKFLRNFLEIYPAIALLAGTGIYLLGKELESKNAIPYLHKAVKSSLYVVIVVMSLSVFKWLPYPAYYLWPFLESPQLGENPVAYVESNAIKDAVEWIHQQGGENDTILFYTGQLQGRLYHSPENSRSCGRWPACVIFNKWLVMLPKYTFQVETPHTPVFRSLEPDHIIKVNQIEMARIIDLTKNFKFDPDSNMIKRISPLSQ